MTLAEIRARYVAKRKIEEEDDALHIPILIRFHGHEMTHLWWPGAWPAATTACRNGQASGATVQFIGPGRFSKVTCWRCKMSGRELGFSNEYETE